MERSAIGVYRASSETAPHFGSLHPNYVYYKLVIPN
jgi:hypothetical protein